jgi:hypothetical protein
LSGQSPGLAADAGDDVKVPAECCDVSAHNVDAGIFAVLDLGDPRLGYAERSREIGLRYGRGLAHLGELMAADICLLPLSGDGLAHGLLGGRARVDSAAFGLHVAPL